MTLKVKLECFTYNKKKAFKDIKNGPPLLLLQGGIAPMIYTTDDEFEKKFRIKYYDFGCVAPENIDYLIEYNNTIIDFLSEKYGRRWKKTVRKDIIK